MSTTDTGEGPLPSGNIISVPGLIRGGQVEKYGEGDSWTATVASGQVATGGLVMEFVTGDRQVRVAQADSVLVAGVAMFDMAALNQVTIASEGVWFLVAESAIAAGQRVVCGAAGTVKPAHDVFADGTPPLDVGAPNAAAIIGYALATQATPTGRVPVKLSL